MMLLKDLADIMRRLTRRPELLSPIPEGVNPMDGFNVKTSQQTVSPSPQPQVNPRNPNWALWKKQNPKGFEALSSGAELASQKHGVPADMMMDLSGLETSGGTQLGSPVGHTAGGYYMFNNPTLNDPYLPVNIPEDFDRNSATQSADLAAQLIKKRQLGRWAVAKGKGAGGNTLGDFYSEEEMSPYFR